MFLEVVAGYFFLWQDISQFANSWRFCVDHHDSWKSLEQAVDCRVDQIGNTTGAPGGWGYMDMLMTGGAGCHPFSSGSHCPGMSDDEYRTEFALWSLTQSPLIIATDVRNLTGVMRQTVLNKELLQFHQNTSTPPGKHLAHWLCSEPLKCSIWGRCLDAAGHDWMVALVNTGQREHQITVTWHQLGWNAAQPAVVKDLWSQTHLPGGFTGKFIGTVPSHGTVLVRIKTKP